MKDAMKYKGFLGSVEVSISEKIIHGKLLFINDLITYEAQTLEELEKEFESAAEDYLETCQTLGREPRKPFSGTFNVRIGAELHQQLGEYSILAGGSINDVIKKSIKMYLKHEELPKVVHNHNTYNIVEQTTKKELFPSEPANVWPGGAYAPIIVQHLKNHRNYC